MDMKCVGVVNCSSKNEVLLMEKLSDELRGRDYKVALVELVTKLKDFPEKKTDTTSDSLHTVVNCFPDKTTFSFDNAMSLDGILALIDADYVLINGFEKDKSYPRVVMLDEHAKDKDRLTGLEIAGYGRKHTSSFPVTQNITQLIDIIEKKSFKLPNLNCKACGFDNCYAFAKEIVKGNRKSEDCISLNPKVAIEIDGTPLPMNPFISGIVEKTIRALLSSFKGYKKGRIEISIA